MFHGWLRYYFGLEATGQAKSSYLPDIDLSADVVRPRAQRRSTQRGSSAKAPSRLRGRAVVFSGVTVAIGLFALVFLPVPFLRSLGLGGMLIPIMSILFLGGCSSPANHAREPPRFGCSVTHSFRFIIHEWFWRPV